MSLYLCNLQFGSHGGVAMWFACPKSFGFKVTRRLPHALLALLGGLVCSQPLGHGEERAAKTNEVQILEQKFRESADDILRQLVEKKVTKVGVLKFDVEEAGRGPLKSPGTLPLRLAEQLETALLLAMSSPIPDAPRVGLAHDASSIASRLPRADHHTPEGRKILFDEQYPLAWGGKKTTLNGLLIGLAEVKPNRKEIRLNISLIYPGQSPTNSAPRLLNTFLIPTNESIIAELGESFHLRSPGQVSTELALQSRADPGRNFPLLDRPGVKLTILYDNRPVTMEFRDEGAWIPEPREGQTVSIKLQRSDTNPGNVGAVLKINGENTLYRERYRDAECHRWVLKPGAAPFVLKGFQILDSKDEAQQFKVASKTRSAELLPDYGADLGTISLTVFREADPAHRQDIVDERPEATDLRVIARGFFPPEPARNLDHLLAQMRQNAEQRQLRGAVLAGEVVGQKIQLNKYVWETSPYLSVVIRYYSP